MKQLHLTGPEKPFAVRVDMRFLEREDRSGVIQFMSSFNYATWMEDGFLLCVPDGGMLRFDDVAATLLPYLRGAPVVSVGG